MVRAERGINPPERKTYMLDPKEVQAVIDEVVGNTKDPLRLTRDFLKQVDEEQKRVKRLEKKLADLEAEKEKCSGNWAAAVSVLEKIEEAQRLSDQAKREYAAAIRETEDVIRRISDEGQRKILSMRYIEGISDWQAIADEVQMSKAAARRTHTAALTVVKGIVARIEAEKKAEMEKASKKNRI